MVDCTAEFGNETRFVNCLSGIGFPTTVFRRIIIEKATAYVGPV
jgi:hypothetical protein